MFAMCEKITKAPKLPAVNLKDYCYMNMFLNCNITVPPELPAGKNGEGELAKGCYSFMFQNCSNLTSAPVLPAINLKNECYDRMFSSCGLTTAPELPAGKNGEGSLAPSCYNQMFYYCTKLTAAPELPATELAESCYSSMFEGCKGLTSVPELPAGKNGSGSLAKSCVCRPETAFFLFYLQ